VPEHPLTEKFFRETVEPTVDEYLAQPKDIRRGRLAAIVLNHMVDYWHQDTREKKEAIYAALRADTPIPRHPGYDSASLVRDIADASKHAKLDRQKPPPQLTDTRQVKRHYVGGLGTVSLGTAGLGMVVSADVRVTLDNGKSFMLSYTIRQVMEAWHRKLHAS
jgi:hypothetical protein